MKRIPKRDIEDLHNVEELYDGTVARELLSGARSLSRGSVCITARSRLPA